LPHAAAKATEAAAPEATEATTATAASTRCMAGTPTYGYGCGKLAQRVPEGEPMLDVRRREVITLLGGAAAAWPLAARAQRAAKTARIGFLGADTQSGIESRLERFRAGLRDLGYVEGDNIFIDFRWAEGNYVRLAEFAAELVRLKVDLLVTYGTPGTLAAKQATTTVPIVMIVSGDAIATGIATSLAHPGKNVTGSTFFGPQLSAKGVELERRPSHPLVASPSS
jgi:putative tryptophan/tyrosine transport system substrate-binding protein